MRYICKKRIEHFRLFNKIVNKKRAIGKKAKTIAIILAYNYYHLNAILENYKIEDMTLKNVSEMENI